MVLFPASASSLNCKSFGGSSTCNQSIIFMFRPHSESIRITFRQQQHLQSNKLSSKAAAPPFNQFHISVAAKPCNQSTSHFGGCKTLQSINFTFWRLQHLQSINFTFWRLQHLQSIIFTFRRLQHLQSINFTFRRQQHLQTAVNQFIFKFWQQKSVNLSVAKAPESELKQLIYFQIFIFTFTWSKPKI